MQPETLVGIVKKIEKDLGRTIMKLSTHESGGIESVLFVPDYNKLTADLIKNMQENEMDV